jgi:UDP-N-acetyl-2-amino-2-deoxyglucuronate dehydrogenase
LRVAIVGTGAIAHKHAEAYRNIGFDLVACSNRDAAKGISFAQQFGADFKPDYRDVCKDPRIDYVDVCAFPEFRLEVVEACAAAGKHVLVEKPIATSLSTAASMIDVTQKAGIVLGVVSQQRFNDGPLFLKQAIENGRLGRLLQADVYVKWYRSPEYYSRPVKGSWKSEGGGALINQAIHQIDILRWLAGPVEEVFGYWQLGALHSIESEDILSGVVVFSSGATGVVQASTAFWPGFVERLEVHGTNGSAILSANRLTRWDVKGEPYDKAPLEAASASGAADPMGISIMPFERQFQNFADAIRSGGKPLVSGEDGYEALKITLALYRSCERRQPVPLRGFT